MISEMIKKLKVNKYSFHWPDDEEKMCKLKFKSKKNKNKQGI
jgi:hypothetical protein